eukprot:5344774-Prymnesium_polylepis.1
MLSVSSDRWHIVRHSIISAPLERLDAEVERNERHTDQERHDDARKLSLVANQQHPTYGIQVVRGV